MELYRNLKLYPGARWDQSPLFKKVYEAEFGQLGGEPYGCLIADYYFSHLPTDVQLLRDLSKIAGAAHAPFFAGADPTLLGMDSWTELSNPRDIGKIFDTPGIRGLEVAARLARFALCRPVPAARAVAPALRRQDRAGRGIRLRGGDRRPQGREIRLDERGLRDGREHQPRLQGIRLVHPHPRRAVGRRGHQPADPHLPDRRRRRRPEMPDRDRDQRPPRGGAREVGPDPADAPQEHRQGGLHRRAVGLQAASSISARTASRRPRPTICRRGCPTCSRCPASRTT